jgi:hypothetical protein
MMDLISGAMLKILVQGYSFQGHVPLLNDLEYHPDSS